VSPQCNACTAACQKVPIPLKYHLAAQACSSIAGYYW